MASILMKFDNKVKSKVWKFVFKNLPLGFWLCSWSCIKYFFPVFWRKTKSLLTAFVGTDSTESLDYVSSPSQVTWFVYPKNLSTTNTTLAEQRLLCTSYVLYSWSLGRIKCRVCHFLEIIEVLVLFKRVKKKRIL